MFKITITAGIVQDRDGKPVHDVLNKLQRIRRRMAERFGGYTEKTSEGGWINDKGELVEEIGRVWTCYSSIESPLEATVAARLIAQFVSFELNQDSVVLEIEPTAFEFISQPAAAQAA